MRGRYNSRRSGKIKPRDEALDTQADRAEDRLVEYDYHAKRTEMWQHAEKLAKQARKEEVQLAAVREFLKRTDPEPSRLDAGGVTITGPTVIVWDLSAQEIPPASRAKALRSTSSVDSNGSTSSSAIADGERPPSASTG